MSGDSNLVAGLKEGYYRSEVNKAVWEVPERYQVLTPLDDDGSGHVCSALDTETNENVAVKKLTKSFESAADARRTLREIKMLKHMHHDNIMGLLNIFSPATDIEKFSDICMVTTLMPITLQRITKNGPAGHDYVQYFTYLLLRGLKYAHSAGIVHMDLRPSNIAVNTECDVKILNFGLTQQWADDSSPDDMLCRWYRAPETLLNWTDHSSAVDIWGVGCIMAELMTGETLFPGVDYFDQLHRIMKLVGTPEQELLQRIPNYKAREYIASLQVEGKRDFPKYFPHENADAIDLLEKMLCLDPEKRITATEGLAHPFFGEYRDLSDEPEGEPFDDSFEKAESTVADLKAAVWEEVRNFGSRKEKVSKKTCSWLTKLNIK